MVRPPVLCFLVSIVCVIEMYGDVWLKNNTEDVAMVSITATDNLDHHLNDVLPGQCVFIASDSASINNISYAMKSQRYVTNCGPALTASRWQTINRIPHASGNNDIILQIDAHVHAREPQGSGYMRIFFDYLSYVHDRYEVTYSVLIWRNSNGAMQSVKNTITGVLGSMQNGKQLIRRIGGKQGNNTLSNGIYFKNDTVDVATVTIEDTHGNEQIITRLDAW